MHEEEDLSNEALNLGIQAYVLKENDVEDLIARRAKCGRRQRPSLAHRYLACCHAGAPSGRLAPREARARFAHSDTASHAQAHRR
jgi:hypothetical protein